MKRCLYCNGVMLREQSDDALFTVAGHSTVLATLVCMLCGRSSDAPVEPERELPPPIPLTGVCANGHDRSVHSWYSRDERTVSGYARRCTLCGEKSGEASRIRNQERGGGWSKQVMR